MNSLDAIIALLVLITSLGILIAGLGQYEKNITRAGAVLEAKTGVFECMSIIDSFYSNSADSFEGEINCFIEGEKIKSKNNVSEKVISVIPKIRKEIYLEIDTSEHYK